MPLTDEIQLGFALEAFGWAHKKPQGWATKKLLYFRSAGITSMGDLLVGCKENTVNLDLELFGIPAEERLPETTIQYLKSFLPGPVGHRCFRLAQRAALKVKKGDCDTEYVHRPASGKKGREQFLMPADEDWTMHVDCAGFVRNCLKYVTKDPFKMLISDRDFMRAKDFFGFFQTIPYSVMDKEEIPESGKHMKWRIVNDLRMVIPGDVIVYRLRGSAAGGAAFSLNDRKDIAHLLKAVKVAQIWVEEMGGPGKPDIRNVARDPKVKPWVQAVQAKLKAIGITTVKDLRKNVDSINEMLKANDFTPVERETLRLMRECATTTAVNTGHIVFAAGPAEYKGDNQYRIRVVHSTKYGKVENGEVTTGVQEHFRRFTMVEGSDGTVTWTKPMQRPKPAEDTSSDNEEDNPNDDMEEEEEDQTDVVEKPDEGTDVTDASEESSGPLQFEVLAARMCF